MLENPVMLEIPVVTQENLANTIPRMSIHKRIKDLREKRGLSMQALAKLVGVSAWQTIQQWEREDGTAPKRERLKAVADALQTTDAYLMFGTPEEAPAPRSKVDTSLTKAEQKAANSKPILIVGVAQLSDNGQWADLEHPEGFDDGSVELLSRDANAYALKCEGDLMRPRIQSGEFVVIEPNQSVEAGDDVLVVSKDGRVMVKRFLYKAHGRAHMISVNDAHATLSFKSDEIEKMHFVRAICRPSSWRPE
jgi:phage repressor protein C with HTH and peptisase S24 domain